MCDEIAYEITYPFSDFSGAAIKLQKGHIISSHILQGMWLLNCMLRLTHWGRVTHICVGKLTIIGSDNGLLPGRCQAITWTNAGILLIRSLGTNFSEILIEIDTFSYKKMHLKMPSAKWRPFCLGLDMLKLNRVSKKAQMASGWGCWIWSFFYITATVT